MNFNLSKMLRSFYADSRHVISVSYKPDIEAFKRTLKIVLFGTLILGIMGFIISIIIGLVTS